MARKTIRVSIPRGSADDMITLINQVLKQHKSLGKQSPLDKEDVTALDALLKKALPVREKAKDFEAKAQSNNQDARAFLGLNPEQSSTTPNTGLYHLLQVRDTLLKKLKGHEEKLSEYGFNVVLGTAKLKKTKKE